jgi:hypothetical protein
MAHIWKYHPDVTFKNLARLFTPERLEILGARIGNMFKGTL